MDDKKKTIAEKDRIRHREAYHNNPERRAYHIEYVKQCRMDADFKARRNEWARDAYHRKKALKKLEEEKANIQVDVN
jgi:hypothetical protein